MADLTKTAIIVSGNKGGVGKSLLAIALVSMLRQMRHPETRQALSVAVLDGDGRAPDVFRCVLRKLPASRADFRQLRPLHPHDPHDAEFEWMIKALLQGSEFVVINTPDGADDTLVHWFRETLQHTEKEGYHFKLMHVMNARGDGLELLPAMAKEFRQLVPVKNLMFDSMGEGGWEAFGAFRSQFHQVPELPRLRPWEANALIRHQVLPHEFVDDLRFPALARQRVRNWLLAIGEEFSDVIFDSEPNVKVPPLDAI